MCLNSEPVKTTEPEIKKAVNILLEMNPTITVEELATKIEKPVSWVKQYVEDETVLQRGKS